MRLHVLSDLHLEFAPLEIPVHTGADVVVLAGDIAVGTAGVQMALRKLRHAPVVYVAGNHEFYGSSIPTLLGDLKRLAEGTHVHVLENDEVVLGGVRFLGCSLWTDFSALGSEHTEHHMQQAAWALNDYHHIQNPDGTPLTPQATALQHLRSRSWLLQKLHTPFDGPTVVVTHHAAVRAAFPRWPLKNASLVSSCVNRMEGLFGGGQVALWIHGHTHWSMDLNVRGTRLVSNQRGYPHRPAPRFDPGWTVDISSNKGK